jgi:hypothetical protein
MEVRDFEFQNAAFTENAIEKLIAEARLSHPDFRYGL